MEKEQQLIMHSKGKMASFGFGSFSREFLAMAFNTFGFYFYEGEIGLNGFLVGIGYVIFALYNMFNDPLIGYLTNKPFKFTKKWGRRFPWIMLGGLPWGLSYILIFFPPEVDPNTGAWILFLWLIFTTCLFDTFHSLFFVNFSALFADKFRSGKERRTASGISVAISVVGVALGAILPPLFFDYGVPRSFVVQGIVIFLVATLGFLISIPGVKEEKDLINVYLEKFKETEEEREPFFRALLTALKQKPFVAYIILYVAYQTLVVSMTGSVPYVVRYSLQEDEIANTLIFAGFLIGVLIATPIWLKLSQKSNNNRKLMIIAGILMSLFNIPLIFIRDMTPMIIAMIIWGTAQGGFWFLIFPVLADVIDNSVVITCRREEGIYSGFQQFFGRIGIMFQAMTFAIVHALTGFVEGAATQSELAVWGIHIHLAVVPMIFMIIGILIFWRFYDLTPEKVVENQLKIKEMCI